MKISVLKGGVRMNDELVVVFTEDDFKVDRQKTPSKPVFYDEKLLEDFQREPFETLYDFGFKKVPASASPSLLYIQRLSSSFIEQVSQDPLVSLTREAPVFTENLGTKWLDMVPFAIGAEYITFEWLEVIFNALGRVFETDLEAADESVETYFKNKNEKLVTADRIYFHLVENRSEDFPFAFLATYATRKEGEKKAVHTPLKNALLEFKDQQKKLMDLLATVSKVSESSAFLSQLMETGELFSPLKLNQREAYTFLQEVPLYERAGVMCRIPDWWRKKSAFPKISISLGDEEPAQVGMKAILSFRPEMFLGEDAITKEEVEALLAGTNGLALLKGKWVEVDHEKLREMLAAYEHALDMADEGSMTVADAMRFQLQQQKDLEKEMAGVDVEVSNGTWLKEIKQRLLSPGELDNLVIGEDFKATLRHYQQTGFDWLHLMDHLGFGALLADDMGLGKTVQIIALLEYKRQSGASKTLLIVPASLLVNWQKELARFAPKINYRVLHGTKEAVKISPMDGIDLFITTYGMAVRLESLHEFQWDLVILDEAQAIKNPGTKQTKAIKSIPSVGRIAMTGTPIENKLGDLWSIFDFLNTGMLGTAKEFKVFAKALHEKGDYARLREVVNPFILRRLKTDKTIISDLPEKIEENAYPALSKKQIVLYKKLVADLEATLKEAEGIQRKGLVLASIMKLKQICNHPDQYLGQDVFKPAESGKFQLLNDICQVIAQKRERVLVFTQFKEMTEPIAQFLEEIFGRPGLILHGGTTVKKRGEMVERFNGDAYIPFMVLSLKAGGVGLNLTRANHVIHFDRWWNPAIENQATDRAFRIGQQKNVLVHKFVTQGTIEEKVDAMIAQKQRLSQDIVVSSGENWITELDNNELLDLFTLTKEIGAG